MELDNTCILNTYIDIELDMCSVYIISSAILIYMYVFMYSCLLNSVFIYNSCISSYSAPELITSDTFTVTTNSVLKYAVLYHSSIAYPKCK